MRIPASLLQVIQSEYISTRAPGPVLVDYVQWAFSKGFLKHWTLTLALELKKDLGKRWKGRWELMRRGPSLLINNSYPYDVSIQGERSQMGTDWIHLGFPLVWIKEIISIIQFVPEQEEKVMVTLFKNNFEKKLKYNITPNNVQCNCFKEHRPEVSTVSILYKHKVYSSSTLPMLDLEKL